MNSAQEKQLIDYLAGIGFTGDSFTASLKEKLALGTPTFRLEHSVMFGDQPMRFMLHFRADPQFSAYRLEGYDAILRQAPELEHGNINGINTALLEQSFREVNWNKYFNDPKGSMSEEERREITALLSDLWQLTARPSVKGKEIQDRLQYIYWPEHAWDDAARDLQAIFDWKRKFESSENGICNTTLAFNILSGRLDDLYEKISVLELDQFPGSDIYTMLEEQLSNTIQSFELSLERNQPEAYAQLQLQILLENDGYYYIDEYKLSVTPYPPIEHGEYNGIHTHDLEAMMRQVDWHNDKQLFIFSGDEMPAFTPMVADIQEQVYRVSQDMVGALVADQLQLKYWLDATFFDGTLQQSAWDLLESLPKREQKFPVELTPKAAYNLLNGRAIMFTPLGQEPSEKDNWMRLDLNQKDNRGRYLQVHIPGLSRQELEEQLGLLPIHQSWYYQVRSALLRGDITSTPLKNESRLLLEPDPERGTLRLYTPDMRIIPANLKLDPDWTPSLSSPVASSQRINPQIRRTPPAKVIRKNKGKGL